jgi:hypothetical protein
MNLKPLLKVTGKVAANTAVFAGLTIVSVFSTAIGFALSESAKDNFTDLMKKKTKKKEGECSLDKISLPEAVVKKYPYKKNNPPCEVKDIVETSEIKGGKTDGTPTTIPTPATIPMPAGSTEVQLNTGHENIVNRHEDKNETDIQGNQIENSTDGQGESKE